MQYLKYLYSWYITYRRSRAHRAAVMKEAIQAYRQRHRLASDKPVSPVTFYKNLIEKQKFVKAARAARRRNINLEWYCSPRGAELLPTKYYAPPRGRK